MDLMPFGNTGHQSSRIIFGAAALARMSQDRSDATIELMRAAGVNHYDTAASYGESELRLAPWLASHRDEVFLATKTGERSGNLAREELERSLERLGTDHVDLIQLHNLVEDADWEAAFAAGGAVEALAQAQVDGLVRHIGVTGHGLRIAGMHLKSLREFPFASVLLPYNFTLMQNPMYRSDVEELLALCAERNVAVQTIKSIARGRWPEDHDGRKLSWYQPIDDADAIGRAVGHVLAHEQLFLNTTSDATKLATILEAASSPTQPTDAELQADTLAQGVTPLFDGDALERI